MDLSLGFESDLSDYDYAIATYTDEDGALYFSTFTYKCTDGC